MRSSETELLGEGKGARDLAATWPAGRRNWAKARDLGHSRIDTEHQLLGVLADRRSGASRVLKGFGITPKRVRDQVVLIVGRGEGPVEGFMPFTPAAKKVLSLALREALMPLLPIPNPPGPPMPRAFQPRPVFVRSDTVLSRVVEDCVGRALDEERDEYGLRELLEAIVNDPEAAAAVESLGLDLRPLRQLDGPEALGGPA